VIPPTPVLPIGHVPITPRLKIDRVVIATGAGDAVGLGDDPLVTFGGNLMIDDIRGDDVEIVIGKLSVLRQTLREVDLHA